jgi:hypothetical protein
MAADQAAESVAIASPRALEVVVLLRHVETIRRRQVRQHQRR